MINASEAYKAAVVADTRQMLVKAVVNIIDPDYVYGGVVTSPGYSGISRSDQIDDKVFDISLPYITMEKNRWILGETMKPLADNGSDIRDNEIGFVSDAISDENGYFSDPVTISMKFYGVSILQACSVYFPTEEYDGVASDFTVSFLDNGTVFHTETFTDNTKSHVEMLGFSVNYPDEIVLSIDRWSLPGRRARVVEIVPGVYEIWDNNKIASFTDTKQVNFSNLALPYGTCQIQMENLDRRYEPRNKAGVFKSIEERQEVKTYIGVRLEDGTPYYVPLGVMYQQSGGWKTGNNGLTMQWSLVDIIGLLADRNYYVPSNLPTTLRGWIATIMQQLGMNFERRYSIDPNYANLPVTVNSAEEIEGIKCGTLLSYLCMATATFPRADPETGYLVIGSFWNNGNKIDLDNLSAYPTMKANEDLAYITFTLSDGTKYTISGNATETGKTANINNPFIHDHVSAMAAARMVLATYGGNIIETTGRGDPVSEIGDVDTVWLDNDNATNGRRMSQIITFQNGVMRDCKSVLLQADGSFLFETREVISDSGTWTAPAGVTQVRLILVGRGAKGTDGTPGTWEEDGEDGLPGAGGNVWSATVPVTPGQTYLVNIGQNSTFGEYSSANGSIFANGFTDVQNGVTFARTGVSNPAPGSGDGGAAGVGGIKGNKDEEDGEEVVENYPTSGTSGVIGALGCVVIYHDSVPSTKLSYYCTPNIVNGSIMSPISFDGTYYPV